MSLEPLDDDILALLGEADAKAIPELAPIAKIAILASIEAKLVLPPGGGGGGGGSPATPTGLLSHGKKALALFAAFALGAGADHAIRPAPAAPAPVIVTRVEPPPVPTSVPEPVMELPATPSAPTPTAHAEPITSPSSRGLAAERGLLDVARAALARGDATEALAAVDRHSREYPNGTLVEEREALGVKALVALGRRDEAARRAKRFEERFPNGLMLSAVQNAVEAQ